MKETLRKVMKRAWEIKKENVKNIFSICLKMAWAEIKNVKRTVVKAPFYNVEVSGIERVKQSVKLAKELNKKVGYWDEEKCEQYNVGNTNKNDVLCVPAQIIDNVVEELKDRVLKVTPISKSAVGIA